jgi:hypothetical protein
MSVMRGEDGGDDLRRRAQTSKVASRLLEQPLRTLGVGVTGIVLGATALFGGLEDADPASRDVTSVKIGEKVVAAPYEITIRKVVWVDELPNVYPLEKGSHWLAITATVRNTHTESLFGAVELKDALALSGVEGLVEKPERGTERVESTYRKIIADTTDLSPVQPGLSYEMVFLFEQRADAAPPTEVAVEAVGHTWRQNSIDKTMGWLDPEVVARGTLPMVESAQQVRAKEAAAEDAEKAKTKKKKTRDDEDAEDTNGTGGTGGTGGTDAGATTPPGDDA